MNEPDPAERQTGGPEMRDSQSENRIQAVENAFGVVNVVQTAGGCSAKEVRETLDLPRSTAYIYLKTLEELGYLNRVDGEYHVGIRFLNHGGRARHEIDVYQTARQEVDELAERTQLVSTIGCEDDGMRVLLYRTGEAVSDNPATGEYTEMHWTALGKALLSRKTDEEIARIAKRHGLPESTEHTHTDLDALLEDVERVRERGYAVEDEERSTGVKAVATPVDIRDGLVGDIAISVAGPISKLTEDRIEGELSTALEETANVIELTMQHY